ncbi:hypothetical protein GCM10022404_03450 [Celeribacter arenosi]|uniref:Polysaccharide biosynthesis protein C-terminal domain-containing protein n=2 Tax=Celeribacter arenosi TaxID=792649 RepID=A0ABP7JUP9_9RHOB
MMVILAPINMISLYFASEPMGILVTALAWGGMLTSQIVLMRHRGFTKLVSGGHVIFWVPLVLLLVFARPVANGAYDTYLAILLAVNLLSLLFDINDLRLWLGGDRRVIGHERSV